MGLLDQKESPQDITIFYYRLRDTAGHRKTFGHPVVDYLWRANVVSPSSI